jgi:DNA gyrase subunit B
MYELIRAGHVYVAQPPLFRVRSKKETFYVQTEEEMKTQLLDRGLGDSVFEPGDGREIKGDEIVQLCRNLAALEEALIALERRGIGLKIHALRQDPVTNLLPVYHVYLGNNEHWFTTREQLDAFVAQQERETGAALAVTDRKLDETTATNGNGLADASSRLTIVELHEVRTINAVLAELARLNFDIQSLIPQERTGREDARYTLRRGENEIGISDLRGLLAAIRAAGEKGLQVTRFKGLGEMNAEELRDTTLDPTNRTLLQVRMEDAGAADDMFRVLMGEKVEPRREFIEKHALEAKNLDV